MRSGIRRLAASPWIRTGGRVGAILVAFLLIERWLQSWARLTEDDYARPWLTAELVFRLFDGPGLSRSSLFRLGMLVLVGAVLYRGRAAVRAPWSDLDGGSVLRLLVTVPVLVLAWSYSSYAYNAYFDQAHALDRLALVGLAGLSLWRPVFVLPFIGLALALLGQFGLPLGGFSGAEPLALVRWSVLFFAFFALKVAGVPVRASDFVFLAFTLLAAGYLVAGLGKLAIGWFALGGVGLLLPATYAGGWLGFLDPDAVGRSASILLELDPLLLAFTLAVECGAAFALLRRRAFLGFLLLWPAFHLGVFALTGIFFWKWILLEWSLFAILLLRGSDPALRVFDRPYRLLAVPVVAGGTLWFHPVNLTWYNAAASYTYRFEGVDAGGCRWRLPPGYFEPYDYQFTLGPFDYLSPHRQLPVTWGATADGELARSLRDVASLAEEGALEAARGTVFYDDARARRFDDFLRRFVATRTRRGSDRDVWSPVAAPRHLWTLDPDRARNGTVVFRQVEVTRITSLYHRGRYEISAPRPVRTVPMVPESAESAEGADARARSPGSPAGCPAIGG